LADSKISALPASTVPLAGTEVLPIVQGGATKQVSIQNVLSSVQPTGTANGVVYLNGSKVATTGSTLTFDGTTLIAPYGGLQLGTQTYFAGGGASNLIAGTNAAYSFELRTNAATRINIGSLGDVTVSTGNIVPGTAAKGINFTANTPAAGMTSQLLNWYEEGTWTPVVAGSTSAGTATYAVQNGRYTKVGRQVFIECNVTWSAGTGTGNIRITGLPFTSANSTTNPALSIGIVDFYTLSALNVMTALVVSNSTRIELYQYPTGGGAANSVAYDAGAGLAISGSYTV
jgi:hypothetical protein